MKTIILKSIVAISIFGSQVVYAQGTVSSTSASSSTASDLNIFKDFDYPELQVVPRASERLFVEAQNEEDSKLLAYWPMQVSALSTLVTGATTRGRYAKDQPSEDYKRDADNASLVAAGVGAGWLAATFWFSYQEPFKKSAANLKKMKGGDKRSDLTRERFAEEALERQAKISKFVMYASVVTNLSSSILVSNYASVDSRNYAYVSAALSFLPLFFQSSAATAYDKQQEYKHKIYAPMTWFDWNEKTHEWTPQVALRVDF